MAKRTSESGGDASTSTMTHSEKEKMKKKLKTSSKVFQDSVHGVMEFDEFLVKIIDTPQFQRMRYIKQLGLLSFVYPAAVHTRFEHSLGTCYLAGQMLDAIERNTDPGIKNDFIKDCGGEAKWEQYKKCVETAALCHDLGHGPFSHTWDKDFIKRAQITVQDAGKGEKKAKKWKHEDSSKKIAKLILMSLGKEDQKKLTAQEKLAAQEVLADAIDGIGTVEQDANNKKYLDGIIGENGIAIILELIDGKKRGKIGKIPQCVDFLYEIVANKINGLDVDKWDYFLRDGLGLHLQITFDYRRALKLCEVVRCGESNKLSFRSNQRISIQDMFRMRADLHYRAYQHRVERTLNRMLVDALLKADDEYKIKLSEAHTSTKHYLRLTDHIVQEMMYADRNALKDTKDILHRIHTRDLYKRVGEWPLDFELSVSELEKHLSEKCEKKVCGPEQELSKKSENNFVAEIINITAGVDDPKNPLENVHFHSKEGKCFQCSRVGNNRGTENDFPKLTWNLPFRKLLVLYRGRNESVLKEAKKEVDTFLENAPK